MARFYDYAKRDSHHWKDQSLTSLIGGAVVIDATNLSDYLYRNEAKGEWDLLKDFFNLAPPFQKFFIECRAPKQILTHKGLVSWPAHLPQQWGVLFTITELSQISHSGRIRLVGDDEKLPKETKWVLQAILFAPNQRGVIHEQFSWWFPVLPDGTQPTSEPRERFLKFEMAYDSSKSVEGIQFDETSPDKGILTIDNDLLGLMHVRFVDSGLRYWYPDDQEISLKERMPDNEWNAVITSKTESFIKIMSLAEDISTMDPAWQFHYTIVEERHWLPLLQPCLMSICFLHCKNVKLDAVVPSPKVQRRASKRYGEPLCQYHVLQIQPMKQVLEREGGAQETGVKRALHAVRGYFSHYGEGQGLLFGKYSGTFWIPTHLRGNINQGLVDKAYRLVPPKSD